MTTITPDAGGSPEPKPSCSPPLLLHHILNLLEAEGFKRVTIISDNVGPLVKAANEMLRTFGVQPDLGE